MMLVIGPRFYGPRYLGFWSNKTNIRVRTNFFQLVWALVELPRNLRHDMLSYLAVVLATEQELLHQDLPIPTPFEIPPAKFVCSSLSLEDTAK